MLPEYEKKMSTDLERYIVYVGSKKLNDDIRLINEVSLSGINKAENN